MKNILIISEVYQRGGAGNATEVVFKFFKKNFNTKILIPYKKKKDPNIYNYYSFFGFLIYIICKIYLRIFAYFLCNNKYYFFTNIFQNCLFSAKNIKKKFKNFKPDYVIITWYEYILNYSEILKIKDMFQAKIIMYPFDMHPLTGGCRYVQSCNNYLNNCNTCPAIKLSGIASKNYLSNKKNIKKINPLFFFPSNFSINFAKNTRIISDKIKIIKFFYPVEKKVFDIYTKPNINEYPLYNLILNKKNNLYKNIVFCGSQDGNEWRKGIFFYKQMLTIFKSFYPKTYKNTMFVYCGNDGKKLFNNPDSNFFIFDFIKYAEIIKIYEISDIIIIPSTQEWSSFMMSESLMYNKITISFNSGSSKDYIKEGFNGSICEPYNFRYIAKKLFELLNQKKKLTKISKDYISQINKNNNKIISYLK